MLFADECFGHPEYPPACRGVRGAKNHADAVVLRSRARRLGQELGNLDAKRVGEAHQSLERRIRVRGRAAAEDSLESCDGFDRHSSSRCKLCLGEPRFEAELLDVICESVRNVGQGLNALPRRGEVAA
jgi:hypothetical protein